jgi:hypothetical protein
MQASTPQSTGQQRFDLSPQQVAYFDTFGFLRVPGLLRADIGEITAAFEEVFDNERNQPIETHEPLHAGQRRVIIPRFIERHETLSRLRDDPRVLGIVQGLIGENYEFAESDGNLFYCESDWHPDIYGAGMSRFHVKLSFYLDSLQGENGAIRVIPGTNHHKETFAGMLLKNFFGGKTLEEAYGVAPKDIPSYVVPSEPGDVIVWNYRTVHASYHGGERRRLFSISFRQAESDHT